jgi:hypothetical protein
MKRLAVVVLLTLLASVAAAPSAQAAPPTHERMPATFDGVDETCGFPVEVHQTGFVVVIDWVAADGSSHRIEAYPQVKATFTNPSTGQSVTVNIAGPGQFTEGADGSFTLVGTGNWGFDHNPETGEPGIFLLSGRFVFSIDAAGNESLRSVGQVVDLCAQLAA